MKRIVKAVFIAVGLVLIAVAIALLLLATQANKLARFQAQRVLSAALKNDVTVASAQVSFFGQFVKINGLVVPNPPGFKAGPAMQCDSIEIRYETRTLLGANPIIDEIKLTGVKANLIVEKDGTNLGALIDEAKSGSGDGAAKLPRGARRAYRIKTLRCEGARVEASSSLVPIPAVGIDIAPFTLEDISKDHPVTPRQVAAIFLKSLVKETVSFKGILRPLGTFLQDELDKLMK